MAEDQLRRDMMQAAPNVTAIVEKGEPTEVIVRVAKARGCDLIVTGIARDETLARFGLGTTVDRLLRRSRVPLLIVKQRARSPYANILVATDFSECSRCALQVAMAFFPDRKLTIFHAYDAPLAGMTGDPARYQDEYRKVAAGDCAAFLAGAGIPEQQRQSFGLLVEHGHPSVLIQQYARDRGVDLVVLGTHGRSALLKLFMGSTAKEILSSLSCDVLVVREPRAAAEGEGRRRTGVPEAPCQPSRSTSASDVAADHLRWRGRCDAGRAGRDRLRLRDRCSGCDGLVGAACAACARLGRAGRSGPGLETVMLIV